MNLMKSKSTQMRNATQLLSYSFVIETFLIRIIVTDDSLVDETTSGVQYLKRIHDTNNYQCYQANDCLFQNCVLYTKE